MPKLILGETNLECHCFKGANGDATIEASFADFVTRSKDVAIDAARTVQDFMFDFENMLGATGSHF